jgi:hypothetical protein
MNGHLGRAAVCVDPLARPRRDTGFQFSKSPPGSASFGDITIGAEGRNRGGVGELLREKGGV